MVVALVALFLAMTGTASALLVITSANIKNGTIRGWDIHNRTIPARKVKRNAFVPASRIVSTGSLEKIAAGHRKVVARTGPFTFTGKCVDRGGGDLNVRLLVQSSRPGSLIGSPDAAATKRLPFELDLHESTGPAFEAGDPFGVATPSEDVTLTGQLVYFVHEFGAACGVGVTGIR
jgi:hypothetical protein